jgi:tRNA A-37 threonylcarbamoyl transferase component Bud32
MAVPNVPTQAATLETGDDETETTHDEVRPMVTDRYQVIRPLGQGGMGIVYEAWDRLLRRRVALKLIRQDTVQEAAAAARLVREARVMAALEHDHVVSAYDVGTWEGRVFIAMQMIEGMTLRHWAQAAPRTNSEKLHVLVGAGRGLAAAHARNIVHRDFKPDNVLVDVRSIARVTDFGIARQLDRTEPNAVPGVDPLGDTHLTRSGAMLGTPAYMAPEQALGGKVTARADQFSFCVTAWELFAGHRPFAGATLSEVLANKVAGEIVPTVTDSWPAGLAPALRRGLAVDAGERYTSLEELLAELERVGTAAPVRPRGRIMRVAAVLGATASAGALTVVLVTSMSTSAKASTGTVAAAPAPRGIQVEAIDVPSPAPAPQVTPIIEAQAPTPAPTPAEPTRPSRSASRKSRPKANVAAAAPAPTSSAATSDQTAPNAETAERPAGATVAAPARPDPGQARELVDRELGSVDAARAQRNLLTADVVGYSATRDQAIAAAARGDLDAVAEHITTLRAKVAAVRIDSKFVDAKVTLLNERATKVHLDEAQAKMLQSHFGSAISSAAADQPEVANRHLTAVGKLLGLR